MSHVRVKVVLCTVVATIIGACGSQASQRKPQPAVTATPLVEPLGVDPEVLQGRLPNGITYYIRKNSRPEKRAELRLVVAVGSTTEDDDQRGLAHVLEHMAFNGTEHYPATSLSDAYLHGGDPREMLSVPQEIESLTPEMLQQAAQKFFNLDHPVRVVLVPAESVSTNKP